MVWGVLHLVTTCGGVAKLQPNSPAAPRIVGTILQENLALPSGAGSGSPLQSQPQHSASYGRCLGKVILVLWSVWCEKRVKKKGRKKA